MVSALILMTQIELNSTDSGSHVNSYNHLMFYLSECYKILNSFL